MGWNKVVILDYINDNRYLLENRVQSFQHGDYHIGNMVINESNQIGIMTLIFIFQAGILNTCKINN
ncbi:hypothetical protein [Clostridium sp. JN-9]|uniref:hypothetical protein n=1 Tax=Clostridium sp. JN-9 TaxID=2507159 RepID=UPI00196A53C5|nr:hypothetical protein [Clostridium sp. JN-9]